jgi:4-aminobutyrate aminotransferase-like enzyme
VALNIGKHKCENGEVETVQHPAEKGGGKGTPLGCAVALKILEVIQRDRLEENARRIGDYLRDELGRLAGKYPKVIKTVRGVGLMLGFELAADIPAFSGKEKTASIQFVNKLHEAGLLAVPAGTSVIRILPPLNLKQSEAEEGVRIIGTVVAQVAA